MCYHLLNVIRFPKYGIQMVGIQIPTVQYSLIYTQIAFKIDKSTLYYGQGHMSALKICLLFRSKLTKLIQVKRYLKRLSFSLKWQHTWHLNNGHLKVHDSDLFVKESTVRVLKFLVTKHKKQNIQKKLWIHWYTIRLPRCGPGFESRRWGTII